MFTRPKNYKRIAYTKFVSDVSAMRKMSISDKKIAESYDLTESGLRVAYAHARTFLRNP